MFVGTLGDDETCIWMVDIVSHSENLTFKMDTGADVTAISEATYESLKKSITPEEIC